MLIFWITPVFGQQFPDYIEQQIKSGTLTREEAKQLYGDKIIKPFSVAVPPAPVVIPPFPTSTLKTPPKTKSVPAIVDASCPATVTIPQSNVIGKIHGQRFQLEKAAFNANSILELRQGKEFFPDLGLVIFLFTSGPLDGKRFAYEAGGDNPHIHVKWRKTGATIPETDIKTDNYQLQLQFGQRQGSMLPGTIYACIPGTEGSRITGTFSAQLN
jgi:hypothetical protein